MVLTLLKSATGRILVEAHRGAAGYGPENSWPAIEAAHRLGADLHVASQETSQLWNSVLVSPWPIHSANSASMTTFCRSTASAHMI